MSSRTEVYVGCELYEFLQFRVQQLEREYDRHVTFREAIVESLSDEKRTNFEEQYRQTTKQKYGR